MQNGPREGRFLFWERENLRVVRVAAMWHQAFQAEPVLKQAFEGFCTFFVSIFNCLVHLAGGCGLDHGKTPLSLVSRLI